MKHLALLIAAVLPSVAAPQSPMTVGRNVQVSTDARTHAHAEVQFSAHPTDPKQLMACSIVDLHRLGQAGMHTSVYTSTDGGQTWKLGQTIDLSADPVCRYGPD